MEQPPVFLRRAWLALATSALVLSACGGSGPSDPASVAAMPISAEQNASSTALAAQTIPAPVNTSGIPTLDSPPYGLVGETLGQNYWPNGDTATGGKGQSVAGVDCASTVTYHIHWHLAIFNEGEMLAIPAEIGLIGCTYEMHTHDGSGKVHIEMPNYKVFTLRQFFALWGQPLLPSNVAGLSGKPVVVYVNDGDTLVPYAGDPGDIELLPGRNITIQVGKPLTTIPSYTPYS